MRMNSLLEAALLIWVASKKIQAKAVFAHYMVGTVTEDHAHQDIDDAIAMGLDAFALNIGDPTAQYVSDALGYLFGYSAYRGFKLFISMDLWASGDVCSKTGNACGGPLAFHDILAQYKGNTAYYNGGPDNLPLISIFADGGATISNDTWISWKKGWENVMHFVPDFDGTLGYYSADPGWWEYWGPIVDGLFSWEAAWPYRAGEGGAFPGDVTPDETVIAGATAHGKTYMIALSPLQYKNAYETNLYRAGDLNLINRMINILRMHVQPDFVQVISWNDGPESHYIGNFWPEQNTDIQPGLYATQDLASHTAWQTSFIAAYKAGLDVDGFIPGSGEVVGTIWYKTILQDSANCDSSDTVTNYYTTPPDGYSNGTDTLNWAVVIFDDMVGYEIAVWSGGFLIQSTALIKGIDSGSATGVHAGVQRVEVVDRNGYVVQAAHGMFCISEGFPESIYNMNYQMVPLTSDISEYSCVLPEPNEDPTSVSAGPPSCGTTVPPVPNLDISALGEPIDTYNYFYINNDCKNVPVEGINEGKFKDKQDYVQHAFYEMQSISAIAYDNYHFPGHGVDASDLYFGKGAEASPYGDEIHANMNRLRYFFNGGSSIFADYISVDCSDQQNICGNKIDGRPIAAYVNTSKTLWGDWSEIHTCDVFFNVQSFQGAFDWGLPKGPDELDMRYLRTKGSYLLHEVMHTAQIYQKRGHIIDAEFSNPARTCIYGPEWVAKAARSAEYTLSYTTRNADSYAQFYNALFWKVELGSVPLPKTTVLPPSNYVELITDSDTNYQDVCIEPPSIWGCDTCTEDGCGPYAAPCCDSGTCSCDCDEDSCPYGAPSCCANGTC